ncbi:MAG: acyltransferase [Chloracidobacterium sp. CP2_5A]|nr:MAG: acyltransferase [Chloracidobacterium sp. CP2_5A]
MTSPTFTIGLVQMRCVADRAENLDRAAHFIRDAARQGAQVICLPELFQSPYFCQTEDAALFDRAEPLDNSPTLRAMQHLAQETKTYLIAPLFERRAAGLYHNSVALVDDRGQLRGLYRKMHIPDDPAYYEKFYFTPGDLGFVAFDTPYGRIASLICWDQWFPEGARLAALRGAIALFYPTAIGWHPREKESHGAAQRDAWRTVQRGHAIANGLYVAAVNRIGFEPSPVDDSGGLEFWGSSFVADPQGVIIADAPTDAETVLLAEINSARMEDVRRNWPFLRDRRIDAYEGLTRRFLDQ